jgi:hypothetical protein
MRKFSGDQFANDARQQIIRASPIPGGHQAASGFCSYARRWPRLVAVAGQRTREYVQTCLALLAAAVPRAPVRPAAADSLWRRWRWATVVFGGGH